MNMYLCSGANRRKSGYNLPPKPKAWILSLSACQELTRHGHAVHLHRLAFARQALAAGKIVSSLLLLPLHVDNLVIVNIVGSIPPKVVDSVSVLKFHWDMMASVL